MKKIVKKESWKCFSVKAVIVLSVLWMAGTAFASRYRIGYDPQQERCLPQYSVFLIDLKDQELYRGAIYAFSAKGMKPFYDDGTQMVKILSGMPGDTVEVNDKWQVIVNGEVQQEGLHLARKLNLPESYFFGKATLPEKTIGFSVIVYRALIHATGGL